MRSARRAFAQYLRLLGSAEGVADKFEVGAGIARSLFARLLGQRGALHVRRSVVVTEGGIRWCVPPWDNSFASAAPGEENSPVVPELLRQMAASSKSTCIDVGANLGYVCMTVAHRFPAKRVVAIEPIPWLAEALVRTATLNGFRHVSVVNRAAAPMEFVDLAVPRLRGVWLSTLSSGATRSSLDAGQAPRETVRVRAQPLDEILAVQGVAPEDVAVVKIDVEGAEAAVLATGPRLLAARPPVLFEAFDSELRTAVEGVLRGFGYRRFEPIDAKNFTATA